MVRATFDNLKGNLQACDRYFVKRNDTARYTGIDGSVAAAEFHYRETEETGRSLVEILADLRLAGCL
ncbi:MAG: hypothetical protein O3C40_28060 [Planctomycetota bacterium]|nr:hypothetical protein [Planctomycetota bacterium]